MSDFSWLCVWDKKGNMITHYEEINDNIRRFSWTEDNRLEAVLDNNMGAFYSYDAAGERHYKLTGATVSVSQNGNSVNAPVFDRQTLYASPLITITDKGYTKHYFEEGNRICSSIGSGGFSNIFQHTSPIVSDLKEINSKTNQNAINTYKNNIGVTPYINVTSIYPYIFYHRSTLYKSAPEAVFYYHTDHLGSATLVTDDAADVVQQIAYLPYGEDWVDIRSNGYFGSAYKFNGKEKDDETGYSYYGARYYTDRLSIWLSVDPLADKYPHLSPYAYCANNPVMYVDPTGMEVEEGSLKEWVKLKQRIEKQRDRLQSDINKLNAKAEAKGWSSKKLAGKIGNKAERLASLNSSIGTMEILEGSTQVYSLSHTGDGEDGGVTLNTSTNIIDIKFGSTANFVHEMTHAGQFETGDVAFLNTGMTVLQDLYDETAAYKAQFGYSPSSVSGLTSTSVANSFSEITPAWVQGLKDATGRTPYAVGGSANTGLIPININSTRDALIQAYPWEAAKFRRLPVNYNIRTLQGIYYKR